MPRYEVWASLHRGDSYEQLTTLDLPYPYFELANEPNSRVEAQRRYGVLDQTLKPLIEARYQRRLIETERRAPWLPTRFFYFDSDGVAAVRSRAFRKGPFAGKKTLILNRWHLTGYFDTPHDGSGDGGRLDSVHVVVTPPMTEWIPQEVPAPDHRGRLQPGAYTIPGGMQHGLYFEPATAIWQPDPFHHITALAKLKHVAKRELSQEQSVRLDELLERGLAGHVETAAGHPVLFLQEGIDYELGIQNHITDADSGYITRQGPSELKLWKLNSGPSTNPEHMVFGVTLEGELGRRAHLHHSYPVSRLDRRHVRYGHIVDIIIGRERLLAGGAMRDYETGALVSIELTPEGRQQFEVFFDMLLEQGG